MISTPQNDTDKKKEVVELPPSLKEHYDKMHMTLERKEPEGIILNKYNQVGGVPIPTTYSEKMKQQQEKAGI